MAFFLGNAGYPVGELDRLGIFIEVILLLQVMLFYEVPAAVQLLVQFLQIFALQRGRVPGTGFALLFR